MDVTCVSGGVRGCLLFVRWCWIGSSLFFLPHPGRGPAESAGRVWPKRGSETEGRSLSALKRGRSEWLRASERRPRKRKRVQFVETVGLEARSGFEASERRRDSVESAGRDAEPERAESAFLAVGEAACTSSLPFWAVGEAACTSSR